MNRELLLQTLVGRLTGPPMVFSFTADTAEGEVELANVSDTTGLFRGLPLFGAGLDPRAAIATIEPTVTMTKPAAATATGVAIRQGFVRTGRRLVPLAEFNDENALFILDYEEGHGPRSDTRQAIVIFGIELWIYTRSAEDPEEIAVATLNNFIDAIQATIDPPATGRLPQNLGLKGVKYCRIEGEIAKDPGGDGPAALAVIPIRIAVAQTGDTEFL